MLGKSEKFDSLMTTAVTAATTKPSTAFFFGFFLGGGGGCWGARMTAVLSFCFENQMKYNICLTA